MTKKLTAEEKRNRRPTSRACVFCHEKHLQCSQERPCKNCVKRGISDECRDIERKRAKYLKGNKLDLKSPLSQVTDASSLDLSKNDEMTSTNDLMTDTTNEVLSKLFTEMKPSISQEINIDNIFDSNYLDEEYKMLGDIITNSKPTSPSISSISPTPPSFIASKRDESHHTRPFISFGIPGDEFSTNQRIGIGINNNNHSTAGNSGQVGTLTDSHSNTNLNSLDNPPVTDKPIHSGNKITDHFSPSTIGYVSPMISHQVYQNVKDIYSNNVIDFEYPQSYHSLTFFLKKRFSGKNLSPPEKQQKRANLLAILRLIASYRPTFISAHKNLYKPWDLQLLEMTFQRSLIDYEKLSNLNSSPTIIWRRTGEIVSISNELISLLNLNLNEILSKRTFIMELMYDDESIVNYFKLFKSIAVGNLHSTIVTKLKLMKLDGNFIEFCSVWTVKRDIFDIPMLILGQFLPILTSDGFRMY